VRSVRTRRPYRLDVPALGPDTCSSAGHLRGTLRPDGFNDPSGQDPTGLYHFPLAPHDTPLFLFRFWTFVCYFS